MGAYQLMKGMRDKMANKPMRLTPQMGTSAMKNPYDAEAPFGMQKMQKPPVNLGPRAKPAYDVNLTASKPMSGPVAKPYMVPGEQFVPDVPLSQDAPITLDPKEEYFAQNAARMKPIAPDMYSMRKNREQDKFYQRPRNIR